MNHHQMQNIRPCKVSVGDLAVQCADDGKSFALVRIEAIEDLGTVHDPQSNWADQTWYLLRTNLRPNEKVPEDQLIRVDEKDNSAQVLSFICRRSATDHPLLDMCNKVGMAVLHLSDHQGQVLAEVQVRAFGAGAIAGWECRVLSQSWLIEIEAEGKTPSAALQDASSQLRDIYRS